MDELMGEDDVIDAPADGEAAPAPAQKMPAQTALGIILAMPNVAANLEDAVLGKIGMKVCEDFDIDLLSGKAWRDRTDEAMKLAMLVSEQKDYPFENSANVKYPLLTTAALQFNARSYPAIVQGNRAVKCVTWGADPQGVKAARAERVSEHMSWQLLVQMPEWEEDTDRLLVMLPIVGSVFRKVYYDPALRRNCTRLVTAHDLVVNYHAPSLEAAPRVTERLWLYPFEIEERIRDGRFLKFDYRMTGGDAKDGEQAAVQDDDAQQLFLEQHRLYDLDEDGYPEPYIVTVHKATNKVVRIVANWSDETAKFTDDGRVASIRRQSYFVKYQFLPSPDGGFYGLGFGWLLKDITETINTTINQMLDAGHLSNMQGGLISSVLGLREKTIRLEKGEWRMLNTSVPLNQAVYPIKYDGPSSVLFQLLGLLVEMGKDVASVKDVLTGEQRQGMTATATLALIEQGLQVFTSIYKRIHRALKAELGILARLNRDNVDPQQYNEFLDGPQPADPKADYAEKDMDILPLSDPQVVTKMQKLAKAQFIYDTAKDNPLVNPVEALKRMFEAADVEDVDKLILPPPKPDPAQVAFEDALKKLGLQEQAAKVNKTIAETLKALADAEAAEDGTQLSYYDAVMKALSAEHSMEMDLNANAPAPAGPGGLSDLAGQPGDAASGASLADAGLGSIGGPQSAPSPVGGTPDASGLGGPAGASRLPQGSL